MYNNKNNFTFSELLKIIIKHLQQKRIFGLARIFTWNVEQIFTVKVLGITIKQNNEIHTTYISTTYVHAFPKLEIITFLLKMVNIQNGNIQNCGRKSKTYIFIEFNLYY